MQNLDRQDHKPVLFYSSSALNLCLKVFTKLHNSISKNTKFSSFRESPSPLRHPTVCASAQLVLTCHQITPPCQVYAPVHSILLVCLDYTVKTPVLKLTPAGVNTGPISNGVNLTPFWCYFNTFRCLSSPVGVISTPKSVEITPKWC